MTSDPEKKVQTQNFNVIKKMLMPHEKFITNVKHFQGKACFSYDYKLSGHFENWDIALALINVLPIENRLFNEKIMQNVRVKPYFDIEFMKESFTYKDPNYDINDIVTFIKNAICDVFEINFNKTIHKKDILYGSCHRDIPKKGYKYSFHFIVNTKEPVYVTESSRNMRYVADLLKKRLEDFYSIKGIVDTSVYKGTQNFRMMGHCKSGQLDKPFVPSDTSIELNEYLITDIQGESFILETPEPSDYERNSRIKNVLKFDILNETELTDELHSKVLVYHPTAQFEKLDSNGFFQFNYTDRTERCFTSSELNPRYHDKLGFFAYITKNDDICLACHSSQCEDSNNKKIVKIVGTKGYNKEKEFKKVCFNETNFDVTTYDIRTAIIDSAYGLSGLFCKMYQNPKRIKWVESGKTDGLSYFWNGHKWESDEMAFLDHLAVKTLVHVLRDFNNRNEIFKNTDDQDVVSDKTENEEVIKQSNVLIKQLNDGRIHRNILKFAKPIINDSSFSDIKDIHQSMLSCKNGMVDLCLGHIRPAIPDDNITKTLETSYNENADTSFFDKFVREITSDTAGFNDSKYNFFRWLIGYSMHGNPIKKLFVILYGPHGYNGKSLVMSVIDNVLEGYSVTMDKSVVLEGPKKTSGSHSTELVALQNARFGILNDTGQDETMDDGSIKKITGVTDKISVREIFGKQQEFKPVFVPFISTNFQIQMNLTDRAMYDRLIIIPFELRFISEPKEPYERKIDADLAQKLENNKEGTLKWLIDAAVFFHQNKDYPIPEFVKEEREKLNKDINSYLNFIDKNFDKVDDSIFIRKSELLGLYKDYAKENSKKYIANTAEKEFDKMLKIITIDSKGNINSKGRTKCYAGISYKNDNDSSDEDEL